MKKETRYCIFIAAGLICLAFLACSIAMYLFEDKEKENFETESTFIDVIRSKLYIVANEGYNKLEELYTDTEFPKLVHLIWFQGFDEIPDKYILNLMSIIVKNPGYTICLWDEASMQAFIDNQEEIIQKKYQEFDMMIRKIDFVRPVILNVIGGIYCDIDVIVVNSFDSLVEKMKAQDKKVLLTQEFFFSDPNYIKDGVRMIQLVKEYKEFVPDAYDVLIKEKIITNAVMYSRKKQKFWDDYINNCQNTNSTLTSCGPLTLAYTYYSGFYNTVLLLDKDILDGAAYYRDKIVLHAHDCQWCGDGNEGWTV